MTVQVTVQPSGRQFPCETDESILAAAIRAGVGLPYGCKNGACGSCKGKLLEGSVTHRDHQERALSAAEQTIGQALFCCAMPQTDVTIEAREVLGVGDVPIKKLPSRVAKIERVSDDVIIMSLQLPATERMQYKAGQYIEFLLKDGKRRSYSILRFEGPLGTFFLREESDKPIVMLASGTGFAPIKALVEHAVHLKLKRPIALYWGGRRPQDLYMQALCEEWAKTLPDFTYVPVISDALTEDKWQGRTGFVHQAVMQDFPDLSTHQVYACGVPVMVEAARHDFVKSCQLPEAEFFADSFTSQADLAVN